MYEKQGDTSLTLSRSSRSTRTHVICSYSASSPSGAISTVSFFRSWNIILDVRWPFNARLDVSISVVAVVVWTDVVIGAARIADQSQKPEPRLGAKLALKAQQRTSSEVTVKGDSIEEVSMKLNDLKAEMLESSDI